MAYERGREVASCSMMAHFLHTIVRISVLGIFSLGLVSCAPAIGSYTKTVSRAPNDTGGTFLARRVDALGNPHDGRSGIYLVSDGPEALAMRLALSERAERTIDAQY